MYHTRANPFTSQHLNWLEKRLQDEKFSYDKIKVELYATPLKDESVGDYNDIYAIKQSDYNKLANSLQLKTIYER